MKKNNLINFIPPQDNWNEWFIGFSEGDGNFQVWPKIRNYIRTNGLVNNYYNIGYGFHLSLSINEIPLLKDIQHTLQGMGHIYIYPEKEEARLAITKLAELKLLVENVFDKGHLISKSQKERYSIFREGILNKINRVETIEEYKKFISTPLNNKNLNNDYFKSSTFDNWIQGFINAEGSFHIHHKGYLVFYIEHTDEDCLSFIKKRLEFSPNITFRDSRSENRKPTYVLHISSKKDINTIKEFCSNSKIAPLLGKKAEQFKLWMEFTK